MSRTTDDQGSADVFDVTGWLDRATVLRPQADADYVPRHRAEVPVD